MYIEQLPDAEGVKGLLTLEGITVAGLLIVLAFYLGWQLNKERKKNEELNSKRFEDLKSYNDKSEMMLKDNQAYLQSMKEMVEALTKKH